MTATTRPALGAVRAATAGYGTPAAALEALVAAGSLADHWADAARAPRWWCEACEGTGEVRGTAGGFATVWWCGVCDPRGAEDARPGTRRDSSAPVGTAAAPPSLPALVAVASLGVDTLARVEAIVAETWPGARLVWRCESAEGLRAVFDEWVGRRTPDRRVERVASVAWWRRSAADEPRDSVAEMLAWCDVHDPGLAPAARAVAALAELDVWALACDAARVVLGVESIGEGRRQEVAA